MLGLWSVKSGTSPLSAGASLFAGRLQHIVRKASLLLGREGHLEAVVLGQEVVAEAYRGKGQFAVDLLQAGLLLPVQQRPGLHEAPVGLLQQPLLLGIERKGPAPLVEVADPRKEPLVEQNTVVMGRQARHELLLQGLQLGVVLRGAEHAEDQFGLRQHRPGAVVGQDDVFERGIGVVRRNGVDLGVVQRHAPLESRQEVFGADLIEGRYAVWRRPLREEGVLPLFFSDSHDTQFIIRKSVNNPAIGFICRLICITLRLGNFRRGRRPQRSRCKVSKL